MSKRKFFDSDAIQKKQKMNGDDSSSSDDLTIDSGDTTNFAESMTSYDSDATRFYGDVTPLDHMINSPILSDIKLSFEDGARTLFAHKIILSAHSIVFHNMFHDVWPMTNVIRTIPIEICGANTFLKIIEFCYGNRANLNRANVYQIMVAANFYKIKDLEDRCIKFSIRDLNMSNVCKYFNICYNLNNDLTKKCLGLFDERVSTVIDSKHFHLNKSALMKLLVRNTLSIDEFKLFKAVHKLFEGNIDRDVLYLIRFPTMSFGEFKKCCDKTVFSPQEIKDITHIITTGEFNPFLSFSQQTREINVLAKTTLTLSDHSDIPCHKLMKFTVTRKVKIRSFTFGDHSMSCDYKRYPSANGIYYGLRLMIGAEVIYECRKASGKIELSQPIILETDQIYCLKTWTSGHRNPTSKYKCSFFTYATTGRGVFKNVGRNNQTFVQTINFKVEI